MYHVLAPPVWRPVDPPGRFGPAGRLAAAGEGPGSGCASARAVPCVSAIFLAVEVDLRVFVVMDPEPRGVLHLGSGELELPAGPDLLGVPGRPDRRAGRIGRPEGAARSFSFFQPEASKPLLTQPSFGFSVVNDHPRPLSSEVGTSVLTRGGGSVYLRGSFRRRAWGPSCRWRGHRSAGR